MDYDQTRQFTPGTKATRQIYRCPCGTDVAIDSQSGGVCGGCQREVPASVTRLSMTMTFSDASRGFAYADSTQSGETDTLIGKSLGHFQIIEPIGKGGMGQVYRALDTSLQRYVAVKVIKNLAQKFNSAIEQQLMHEAVAQARVNHPNIVTIYYVGRENDTTFLAMELVEGYDASQLVRQGEIPYETLCSIAVKISDALDLASQTGIIHSDIKPQNLLVVNDGNVKLSDFGMARFEKNDQDSALGGTPNYLAPELLRGEKPSIQSDMYALGVTLFELTFGRLPVQLSGHSISEWSEEHESVTIIFPDPWPDHLPEKWKIVLEKLLAREPSDRYVSYAELREELESILPIKRKQALILTRSIAWIIDIVVIGLAAMLPLAIASAITDSDEFEGTSVTILAMLLYLSGIYWWRQSIGRELVNVKVVNRYSLQPTRRTMLIRECLRMSLLLAAVAGDLLGSLIPFTRPVLLITAGVWTVAELAYAATWGRGCSFHDRMTGTTAVVGSDSR